MTPTHTKEEIHTILSRNTEGYFCNAVSHGDQTNECLRKVAHWSPSIVAGYNSFCKQHSWQKVKSLGMVYFHHIIDNIIIANVFCCGSNEKETHYDALYRGLYTVKCWAIERELPIYIPTNMGCVLQSHGDWEFIYNNIIMEIFEDGIVPVIIAGENG